jgi:MFS family permease
VTATTVKYSTIGRDTTVPAGGARTYARLWPMQYLSGMVIAVATLGIVIRADAFASFYTGSAVLLAVGFSLTFFAFTPGAVLAGWLVDRWGPKKTLVVSNVGYVVLMALALVALAADFFPAWLAIALLLGRTGSQAVQITALESSVPVLFARRDIVRANGSRLFLTASVAGFEAPLADALFPVTGLLVLIGFTCVVLIASLVGAVRADIPSTHPQPTERPDSAAIPQNYEPLRAYLRGRPGLVTILAFFALFNFAFGFAEVSDRSITEGIGSEATTNVVLGIGFVFMLATTVLITVRGTPRAHVRWLRTFLLILGAALVLGAARPSLLLVTAAVVLFLISAPFVMAIVSTLLHTNTAPELMGRMMGVKTMIIGITYGAGNVVGALCSAVPEPLVGGKHLRGGFFGALVGTGDATGRGYAVLTMLLGVLVIGTVLIFGRHRSLRDLETDEPEIGAERRSVDSDARTPDGLDPAALGGLTVNPSAAG